MDNQNMDELMSTIEAQGDGRLTADNMPRVRVFFDGVEHKTVLSIHRATKTYIYAVTDERGVIQTENECVMERKGTYENLHLELI